MSSNNASVEKVRIFAYDHKSMISRESPNSFVFRPLQPEARHMASSWEDANQFWDQSPGQVLVQQ